MNLWREFEEARDKLFRFTNGKKVVIWGYGYSGWFIEHLFRSNHRQVEYIVDDHPELDYSRKIKRCRSLQIEWLNRYETAVILTFKKNEGAESYLELLGYKENVNYIYAKKVFYGIHDNDRRLSYYDWLERKYKVDIVNIKKISDIKSTNKDNYGYSSETEYAIIDVLGNFMFNTYDAVFDFGCGKGGKLILFEKMGVNRIGGVEYDRELYDILKSNFEKLGISSKGIICSDAAQIDVELDAYNYFYMYNPFGGKTFCKCLSNIENSVKRNPRVIYFIYEAPVFHSEVIKSKRFVHTKTIETDQWIRSVNVYTLYPNNYFGTWRAEWKNVLKKSYIRLMR